MRTRAPKHRIDTGKAASDNVSESKACDPAVRVGGVKPFGTERTAQKTAARSFGDVQDQLGEPEDHVAGRLARR